MITVVPVRFSTNTDPNSVWSQELFENWMQPLREYSLANFWWLSSVGHITPESRISAPIVIDDPRTNVGDTAQRATLIKAAVDKATETVHPDWVATDVLLLWFAQPTDAFGGGVTDVPLPGGGTKQVTVTVVDLNSTFDICAQELGHALGFDHEIDTAGNEYASPYSSMSSRRSTAEFVRPSINGLPDGAITGAAGPTNPGGTGAQRIVGPRIPGAQFHKLDSFRNSSSVVTLPADWGRTPASLRLYPPNYQSRHPQPPATLVAVPSRQPGDQRLFFVEFRRGRFDYDQGIGSKAPAGLTVHSRNPDGRIRYDGVAPVSRFAEMRDWVCPAGNFVLRYDGLDTNHEYADIQIRSGSYTSFPIRGVLLVGGFRSQRQLNEMSHDDMRNTLIVELTARSNDNDYQRYDNDTLTGIGAAMVFLRNYGLRSDAELATMSADDIRNTLIVEVALQTGVGQDLQGHSNLDLIRTVLGSDIITAGRAPGVVGSYLRGVLLLGGFRGQRELNMMSLDDMRNTLIVELTQRTAGRDFQAYSNPDLEGAGAVLIAVRQLALLDDATLATTSVDTARNALIVELDRQTAMGQRLQALDNLHLATTALGIEPPR